MTEEKGIYSKLNEVVKQMKSDGKFIIEREELTRCIDVSNMDREELEERYKNAAACNVLWANEFRSYIKGKGIFLDYKTIKSKLIMGDLLSNAVSELRQKADITRLLEQLENDCVDGNFASETYSQMFLCEDEEGNTCYGQERTNAEIIALLKELQDDATKVSNQ